MSRLAHFLSLSPARSHLWQWPALVAASLALGYLFLLAGFPAALLLGPMLSAIAFGLAGASIRVPRFAFTGAQALIGLMVAGALTPAIVATVLADWPLMFGGIAATVLASAMVGYLLVRFEVLPGSTAAWGSSPGAASAMVAMAEEFGADPRLVAFMQYLRMALVTLAASVVTRLALPPAALMPAALPSPAQNMFALAPGLALTLVLAVSGIWIARRLNVPAGAMLVPMLMGGVLHGLGLADIVLPHALLELAYAAIGWTVGLRFDRAVTDAAINALPRMLVAIIGLMALCATISVGIALLLGKDFVSTYLAMSPGGLDTIAIIAVGSHVDVPFVLALQTLRLVLVVITGPFLARLIVRLADRPRPSRA